MFEVKLFKQCAWLHTTLLIYYFAVQIIFYEQTSSRLKMPQKFTALFHTKPINPTTQLKRIGALLVSVYTALYWVIPHITKKLLHGFMGMSLKLSLHVCWYNLSYSFIMSYYVTRMVGRIVVNFTKIFICPWVALTKFNWKNISRLWPEILVRCREASNYQFKVACYSVQLHGHYRTRYQSTNMLNC